MHLARAVVPCTELFRADRIVRALGSAGAAFHALIGVDDVLVVALGDDAERTCVGAGAALDASIADNISHSSYLQLRFTLS